jgi:hypothetical protein
LANLPVPNPSGWLTILSKLGVTGIVRWFLSDTVIPVALVDSEILLQATSSTPLVNAPASAGELTAPAANTRLATTGALPGGPYNLTFWLGTANEVNYLRIRRRNAADTADIWSFRWGTGGTPGISVFGLHVLLANNEFVVVENVNAGGAGAVYQAAIFASAG